MCPTIARPHGGRPPDPDDVARQLAAAGAGPGGRIVLGIDPGPEISGLAAISGRVPVAAAVDTNDRALLWIAGLPAGALVAVEVPEPRYGVPIGRETLDTCVWAGRFVQAAVGRGLVWSALTPSRIRLLLCGTPRARLAEVRQALIDRYGPTRRQAIGTRAAPGPLYGVHRHAWAALAVAVVAAAT